MYISPWAGEMAQQIGVVATKLDDLSLSPGIHLGEERTNSSKLSSDLHKCSVACMCPHNTHNVNTLLKEELKRCSLWYQFHV